MIFLGGKSLFRKAVPIEYLVNMAKFVLKNNYLEFNSCIRKKILVQP